MLLFYYKSPLNTLIIFLKVVGVDVSKEMIGEAKKLGDPEDAASGSSNSLIYITANATDLSAYMPLSNQKEGFDVVTCQYLFPYASNKEELFQMIKAAFVLSNRVVFLWVLPLALIQPDH